MYQLIIPFKVRPTHWTPVAVKTLPVLRVCRWKILKMLRLQRTLILKQEKIGSVILPWRFLLYRRRYQIGTKKGWVKRQVLKSSTCIKLLYFSNYSQIFKIYSTKGKLSATFKFLNVSNVEWCCAMAKQGHSTTVSSKIVENPFYAMQSTFRFLEMHSKRC